MSFDKKENGGAVPIELSQMFFKTNHELVIATLQAYGFSKNALNILLNYISGRWQRAKTYLSFSSTPFFSPVSFNIFPNYSFWFNRKICIFANDTTSCDCDMSLKSVL